MVGLPDCFNNVGSGTAGCLHCAHVSSRLRRGHWRGLIALPMDHVSQGGVQKATARPYGRQTRARPHEISAAHKSAARRDKKSLAAPRGSRFARTATPSPVGSADVIVPRGTCRHKSCLPSVLLARGGWRRHTPSAVAALTSVLSSAAACRAAGVPRGPCATVQ